MINKALPITHLNSDGEAPTAFLGRETGNYPSYHTTSCTASFRDVLRDVMNGQKKRTVMRDDGYHRTESDLRDS